MGAVCGKANKKKIAPGSKINSIQDLSMAALRDRNSQQIAWEEKNSGKQTSIESIWPMTIPNKDIGEVYVFDNVSIGQGQYGAVRKAKHRVDRSKVYAVKTVKKAKLNGDISLFKNELDMLRFSDHSNIVRFYEIYQDSNSYYFVLECCEGGDLTTLIENKGALEEGSTRKLIYQSLLAINHLHTCGIVHRDIKCDNFLLKTPDGNSQLKLTDFGLSKRFQQGGKMTSLVGTPFYVAPEVIEKRGYSEKCDIWSVGVMMYLILTADYPFRGSNNQEIFEKVKRCEYSMTASKQLLSLSKEGQLFLKGLLNKNPSTRFSAREALRDPWFTQLNIERNDLGKSSLSNEVFARLKNHLLRNKFSKEVIRFLVILHDDNPEVRKLQNAFFSLDVLNNGIIGNFELETSFGENDEKMPTKELDSLLRSLAMRTKKVITYTDFITGAIDSSFYLQERYLREAFKRLDIDQDNIISFSDLSECFGRFGIEFGKSYIKDMIEEFSKGDKILYTDFVEGMKRQGISKEVPTKQAEDKNSLIHKPTGDQN